jgi:hypothetical protein
MTTELENISVSEEGAIYQIFHDDYSDIFISKKNKPIFESLFPSGSEKKFKALINKTGDKVYANYLIDQKIPCDGSFIEVQKWNFLNKETKSLQIFAQIDEEEISIKGVRIDIQR